MTRDNNGPRPLQTNPGLQQSEPPAPQSSTDPDYRELERCYHQSAEYAAMVERYPLLRRTIQSCRNAALVGRPTTRPHPDLPGVLLRWQRSHGEG